MRGWSEMLCAVWAVPSLLIWNLGLICVCSSGEKEPLGQPCTHTEERDSCQGCTHTFRHKGAGVHRHSLQLLLPLRLKFKSIKIWKFGIVDSLNFVDNLSINTITTLHITKF